MHARLAALAAAFALTCAAPAHAQQARIVQDCVVPTAAPARDSTALMVDQFGRLCTDSLVRGAAVYAGGTIATANTSQVLLAQNPARRGFTVQNQSTSDLYVKIGGVAATTNNLSLRIAPGLTYETPSQHVSTGSVAIIGATAGQAFYATEY